MTAHWSSFSSLDLHRSCPQAYMYERIRKLETLVPEAVRVELEFGNWWHMLRAADSVERGLVRGSLRAAPQYLSAVEPAQYRVKVNPDAPGDLTGEVLTQAERWWRSLPSSAHEIWDERIGGGLVDRLLYSNARYRDRWGAELDTENPVAVEVKWTRQLPADPDGVDPDTTLVGYIDEIYLDTRRNLLVVRDHKAHKDLSRQTVVDDMMDSQLQLYAWGVTPLVNEWGLGPVRAVAYDRMRMVAPNPPQLTQSGRLAQRGGQPSIGSCDLTTYLAWAQGADGRGVPYPGLKKDGSGAGLYTAEESVVEKLSTEQAQATWFQRTLTPLNRNVVTTHLRAAVDSALDVTKTRERVERTNMAGRNLTRSCTWCDFVKLCRAEMIGGPNENYDLEEFGLRESR